MIRSSTVLDSALAIASRRGDAATVRQLLADGADIHANEDEALYWAVEAGQGVVVSLLLANGADVHTRDEEPLHVAAAYNHQEVVSILLANGADRRKNDNYARRLASRYGHHEVLAVLAEADAAERDLVSTYILEPNVKRACDGKLVDTVTTLWEADGRWVVGERMKDTGVTTFNHRSYESLAEVCAAHGLHIDAVRNQAVGEPRAVPTTPTDMPPAPVAKDGKGAAAKTAKR